MTHTKKRCVMSDDNFDPYDMEELNKKFDQIIRDTENGYVIEFHMSRLAAREMVEEWVQAILGVPESTRRCMENYSYIVTCIMDELKKDDQ